MEWSVRRTGDRTGQAKHCRGEEKSSGTKGDGKGPDAVK